SPDNWNMDLHFLERPGARIVQLDLLYDYRTNVELYPQWQSFLRERRPKTLILRGENDLFFTPEGGRAYLRDLADAELHLLARPTYTCQSARIQPDTPPRRSSTSSGRATGRSSTTARAPSAST